MTATKNPFDIITHPTEHDIFNKLSKFGFLGDISWAAEKLAQSIPQTLFSDRFIKDISSGYQRLQEDDGLHHKWRERELANYFIVHICDTLPKIIDNASARLVGLTRSEIDDKSKEIPQKVLAYIRNNNTNTKENYIKSVLNAREMVKKVYGIHIEAKNINALLAKLTNTKAIRRAMLRQSKRKVAELERKLIAALRAPWSINTVQQTALSIQKDTDERGKRFISKAVIKDKNSIIEKPISLAEVVEQQNKTRLAELTAKITGIKNYAEKRAWSQAMITLTLPSEHHPTTTFSSKHRRINKNYDYSSVKDGWLELHKVHNKVRKFAQKNQIECIGVSAPQPHKDGTPHLHIYIAAHPDDLNILIEEYKKWNTSDPRRTDVKMEDPELGSLSTYLIRYAMDAMNPSSPKYQQTNAWYKVFGIRRFNFFGMSGAASAWNAIYRLLTSKAEAAKTEIANFTALNSTSRALFEAIKKGDFAHFLIIWNQNECAGKHTYDEYENAYGETAKRLAGMYNITIGGDNAQIKIKFFRFTIEFENEEDNVLEKVIVNYPSESYALKNTEMNTQNVTNDTEKITSPE